MTELHGIGPIARLILRRDRARLVTWIVGIVLLVIVTAASTKDLYATQADLDKAAFASRDNPVALAFNGPDQALDTMGGQVAFQVGAFGMIVVGLMNLLLVSRMTRGEEDSGRLELVRSLPVGRHAPLAAGLLVIVGADVLLGVLVTGSLLQQDLPLAGSITFGASYTVFGLCFAGITATTAQLTDNPRVTSGLAGALLGASFALRAIGDVGDGTLSWWSPMGWAQRARPYAGERWWPLLLCLGLGAALTWAARALTGRRDFGAGMFPPRPGPPHASVFLGTPLGLAIRLHRGAVAWWAVASLALGLVYGSLTESIEDFVGDNQAIEDMLAAAGEGSLTDTYLSTALLIVALIAAGPAVQLVQRLHTEEAALRAEAILATRTSRATWAGSHLVVALAGGALTLAAGGLGTGAAYAATGGGAGQVGRLLGAALVYVPAVWLLAAIAFALFAVVPRWTAVAWVALAGCFVVAMFGPLLELPAWLMGLSPFDRTPALPADAIRALPLVVVGTLAAALVASGVTAFRHRDLTAT